ncbi:radical SAM protein [Uliginosibacterium sp. 31-12]|uniref:radical SAM/SPASM domain-containing protein n=1 Tax=Uliginosibacterium sp. 31-12 TaxID=3062781 RepID=UPI0026E1ED50|nr:radical SAM protein [Uliginosibacterium sp. 31-12]MDO6385942.1 radical SAM protein [Uliginosibacterium sp. 31-12]
MNSVQPITLLRPTPSSPDKQAAIPGHRVELQLLTTLKCNLKCTYCSLGVGEVLGSQQHVDYSLDQLSAFVDSQLTGLETYVTFYGGEPTLNRPYMEEVIARFPNFRYQLQTNGTLLDGLPDAVLARMSNFLISIDGGEGTTDGYRGRGIYRQVMKNLAAIRPKTSGSITARMTWSHPEISFEEIDHLTEVFDYLYFQFVADRGAYPAEGMAKRKAIITQMVAKFFQHPDRLYPIIPIMGMVRNKVMPSKAQELYQGKTQCRASTHILNVMPDGRIFPCPDLLYLPEMQQGSVVDNWLRASPLQPDPAMPCASCEAYSFCRGNCMKNLYLAYVKQDEDYRREVVEPICELVRFMGEEIDRHDPQAWFARASLPVRKLITDCEVYEYVEIMP